MGFLPPVRFVLVTAAALMSRIRHAEPLNAYHRSSSSSLSRRTVLQRVTTTVAPAAFLVGFQPPIVSQPAVAAASYSSDDFEGLLAQVKRARQQLEPIPKLIEQGKWDAVRAVLLEPPLADCWAKTNRPLLAKYGEALGDVGGDELAALEAKEDVVSHLRYLDMAVYNNNFNPITVAGETGASQQLIKSYYEDPINEYRASARALDEMINLSKDK